MLETWLRFEVAEHSYALPLDAVTEVTRAPRRRMIPGVPLSVGGVLNVRGEPLPVVDGAVLLGEAGSEDSSYALLLQRGALRIGLLVARVSRIERHAEPQLEEEDSEDGRAAFVHWVGRGKAALGLVDPHGLLEQATALLTEPRVHDGGEDPCPSAF